MTTRKNFVSSQVFILKINAKIRIPDRFRVALGQCMMHFSLLCCPRTCLKHIM